MNEITELLAALVEMKKICSVYARTIIALNGIEILNKEIQNAGIKRGYVERAEKIIKKYSNIV